MAKKYLIVGKIAGMLGAVTVVKHFDDLEEAACYLEQAHRDGVRWVEDPLVYPVGEPRKVALTIVLTP